MVFVVTSELCVVGWLVGCEPAIAAATNDTIDGRRILVMIMMTTISRRPSESIPQAWAHDYRHELKFGTCVATKRAVLVATWSLTQQDWANELFVTVGITCVCFPLARQAVR